MSAIEQIQAGDWITGPTGTRWQVGDTDDRHDTIHLVAESGTDLWVDRDECRRKLAAGTFDHTTDRLETDQ
jgi:hypothetical protein